MTKRPLAKSTFAKKMGLSKGRISQLIGEGLPVEPDGRIDEATGRDWIASNLDPERSARRKSAGTLSPDATTAEARRQKAITDAERAALELEKIRGSMVDRAAVERAIFGRARAERDTWLQWPLRVASDMAAELRVDESELLPVLKRHVRDHLTELGEVSHDSLSG